MKYSLPISADYCSHWGLWEAIREIYQNALDESVDGSLFRYVESAQRIDIFSPGKELTPSTLVLGNSSKRDDLSKRGKFGEGYKIALLALVRLKHRVVIHTGEAIWLPRIERDQIFGAEILTITTILAKAVTGVWFHIADVTLDEWTAIQSNVRFRPDEPDTILDDPKEVGRIYVGGLYVATVKGFKCGYAFAPGRIKLDRDRGMVDGFDLAWETSLLWKNAGHSERLSELMEAGAPDVEYVDSHTSAGSAFVNDHYNYYVSRHGYNTVPVTTQEEIQRATVAGIKWVLVPEKVKNLLSHVRSWFIPNHEPPVERLKKFEKRWGAYLTSAGRRELADIIKSMEG
jgi:hypothetical protein